jgi:hypothetical protein
VRLTVSLTLLDETVVTENQDTDIVGLQVRLDLSTAIAVQLMPLQSERPTTHVSRAPDGQPPALGLTNTFLWGVYCENINYTHESGKLL